MSSGIPASAPSSASQLASTAWTLGVLMAVAGVLSFSIRPILIKLAYGYGAEPVTLLALRMVFSLPFLLALAL